MRTASPGWSFIGKIRPTSAATLGAARPAAFTTAPTAYVAPPASSTDVTAPSLTVIARTGVPNAVVARFSTAAATKAWTILGPSTQASDGNNATGAEGEANTTFGSSSLFTRRASHTSAG